MRTNYLTLKNPIYLIFIILFVAAFSKAQEAKNTEFKLWYKQAASEWDEALPVGNGRLGAMVYGGVYQEEIQLNEESLWAGERFNTNNPNALRDLPKMRELIFNGDIKEAYELGNKSLLSTPPRFRSYQTFGQIKLKMNTKHAYSNYKRELILNTGINTTTFEIDGVTYTREVFASAPDNIILIHLSADQPGSINTTIELNRIQDAKVIAQGNQLILQGQIIDKTTKEKGKGGAHMKFAGKLVVLNKGGDISTKKSSLKVKNADEINIIFTAATDYNFEKLNWDRAIHPLEICGQILNKVKDKSYDEIKNNHIKEHEALFNRVDIKLTDNQGSELPTDQRVLSVREGNDDPALVALYFQYGRYLLMGSSRAPGILPANLQGIWNKDINAPWNADYHTNINLQMNYWPAEVCNLSETVEPLTDIVDKWREPGRVTASEMYGCSGWAMHHATDVFGKTSPNADMRWGMSPLSGVWMTFPLWRHYEFTMDQAYLKDNAYPIMKEAMAFISDFLIEKDHYLVTNPTMSPENAYILPGKKQASQLTYAATIDNQTLRAHINHCIQASKILEVDEDLRAEWEMILSKIPPTKIGKDSTIMEWIKDYEEFEPGHRHMSHLLGLYPLAQITPETPDLFIAAKRTIEKRLKYGGGHTGWSRAWMINFFARLQDPENAYAHTMALLRKSTKTNLFDNHPPFQIDGNFGGTAGIAEMLLQSYQENTIHILPALPKAWPDGYVTGLKARGNYTVDIYWHQGELTELSILATKNGSCKIQYQDKIISFEAVKGETYKFNHQLKPL